MPIKTHNSIKPSSSSGSNPSQPPSPNPQPPHRRKRRRHRSGQGRQPNKPVELRQEVSAGGIIYRRRQGVAEIFFIKDPFGKWTFPKGHQEPGEALPDTAIRECGEEAGLFNLRHVMALGRTAFRFRRQGVMIQKTVHFFLLEAPPDAKEHFVSKEELPEGQEPIFEGRWVRLPQVFHVSSYKNSDRLLARALRAIAPRPHRPPGPPQAQGPRPPQAPRPPQPPRPTHPPRPLPPQNKTSA